MAYLFTWPVVLYYMLFRPTLRKRTRHYLDRRFPAHTGLRAFLDSFRLSLSFAKTLVDRATTGVVGPDSMRVRFDTLDEFHKLAAQGKGMILINAHVGCWQTAMSGIHWLQRPVNLLMKREPGDVDRHYHEHRQKDCHYKIIDPEGFLGGAVEIVQALQRGEIVSVMGDRVFGNDKNTLVVSFMGEKAVFPVGAYKIAAATGAPVAVMFSHKTGPDSYAMELARVIRIDCAHGLRLDNLRPYVCEFVRALEEYALRHPYQVYNFHNMWAARK